MPTTNDDLEKIRSLRDAASDSTRMAADIGSTATTLHDNIMAAVRDDRINRGVSQMAKDVGAVGGQLVTEPNMIREHGGDVANPMDIDRFTSSARASNMRTLGTIATQGEKNYGTLQEIIGAGANQLRARAQNKLAEAQQKAEEANAMMEQLNFQEQMRQFNETLAEQKRQFDLKFNASGSGSGSIQSLIDVLTREGQGGGGVEEEDFDIVEKGPEQQEPGFWQQAGQDIEGNYLDPLVGGAFNKLRGLKDKVSGMFQKDSGKSFDDRLSSLYPDWMKKGKWND